MACYLLSTIPFRPLLNYKSDRLEVLHSCTIFLSVAWMVKYRNDPYRNSNMNKNSHILPTGQWYAPSAVINDALIIQ